MFNRVWFVLKSWTEHHFNDFEEDEELLAAYIDWVTNTLKKDMEKLAIQLLNIVDKQTKKTGKADRKLLAAQCPTSILPFVSGELTLTDISPLEFSRQLTLIEYSLYNEIQPKGMLLLFLLFLLCLLSLLSLLFIVFILFVLCCRQ
jgi:hypothetical protein